MENYRKIKYQEIFREIFYFFSLLLLVLVILELLSPGLVIAYFNLNYLLLFWLVNAVFLALCTKEKK